MTALTPWSSRPVEVRNLLNPAFCALVLFEAVAEYGRHGGAMDFEVTFLVLPLLLDERTRNDLPRDVRTPLALWASRSPQIIAEIPKRVQDLAPFTREALIWAGSRGYIKFRAPSQFTATTAPFRATQLPLDPFEEIGHITKRAKFVGKWLASARQKEIIFMLLGIRP